MSLASINGGVFTFGADGALQAAGSEAVRAKRTVHSAFVCVMTFLEGAARAKRARTIAIATDGRGEVLPELEADGQTRGDATLSELTNPLAAYPG